MPRLILAVSLLFVACAAQAQVVFTVDSTADLPDATPGNGACAAVGGICTLRAALHEAHALPGALASVEVRVPPGVYVLSHTAGDGSANAASGDLDLWQPAAASVTLRGWSGGIPAAEDRPVITIAPGFPRRLLRVAAFAGQTVRLADVVLADARPVAWNSGQMPADIGAAILCTSQASGTLELERVRVSGMQSQAAGALYSQGCSVTLVDSEFDDNCTRAAIFVSDALPVSTHRTVRLQRVSFSANRKACINQIDPQFDALSVSGLVAGESWDVALENVSVAGNDGAMRIIAPANAPSLLRKVSLRNVTFHDNAPGQLGVDALYADGDVHVLASHSALGAKPVRIGAQARYESAGHVRAIIAPEFGGAALPHASDLSPLHGPVGLGPLVTTGPYTQGHRTLPGSPLIDAGAATANDADFAACAIDDQEKTARPLGVACDIGALEAAPARVFADGFE